MKFAEVEISLAAASPRYAELRQKRDELARRRSELWERRVALSDRYRDTATGETTAHSAFRLRLTGGQKSLALAEEVRGGRLSQMSIGINVLGSEMRTIAGQGCRVVKAAELVEISAVATGAIRETTIELVDLSERAPFESEVRTGRLAYDFAAAHFVRNLAAHARAVGPHRR